MRLNIKVYAGLIAVGLIWGGNFGVSRFAMDALPADIFLLLRFGLAVPFYFALLKWMEGDIAIQKRDVLPLALVGFFGIAVLELLVLYSIKYTSLANASLLNVAPWPLFSALFAPFFTREAMTWRVAVGGAAAFIGVACIILGGGEGLRLDSEHLLGNVMALASSLVGALYNLACMPLMRRYSPLRVSSWYILLGVLCMIPMSWRHWEQVKWELLTPVSWAALAYNVLLCTVAGFLLWNWGMNRIGATKANFFRYVVPAAAVLVGYLFFDESIRWTQLAGGLLMAAGLVWIGSEKKAPTTPLQISPR